MKYKRKGADNLSSTPIFSIKEVIVLAILALLAGIGFGISLALQLSH